MMRATSIFFVFFISIFLLVFIGHAQNTQKDSIKTIRGKEIILISQIQKKAVGITNSTRISEEIFESFSPLEITNSLNQIPGLYALSGAINTNRITIRGVGARTPFGTDKLRMYYNNIPVTNGTGTSTIEIFDVENLSSIEVIKGPKGTHFGANLGGAILLNSKPIDEQRTEINNNFTIGSFGMLKDNVSFQTNVDQWSVRFAYNHTDTEGFRENNNFTRNGILLNTDYKINERNTVGILFNYIDVLAQIPSSISQTAFEEDPTQAAGNWLAAQGFEDYTYNVMGVYYQGKLSDHLENSTSLFYNFSDNYEARPFNILDESTFGYGFKSQFSGSFSGNSKTSYSLGVELYRDEYEWATFRNEYRDNNGNGSLQGDQLSDNKEFRSQLNFSSSFLVPISNKLNAQFNVGLNVTSYDFLDIFNTGDENQSASRSFDPILLPSLSLEYALNTFHSLNLNLSRGFSNPSLEETLTPDGLINPDIEQEKGISYELTSNHRFFNNNLSIVASVYRMDITDLLVAQRVGEDQYIGRNAGKTRHQGLELDVNYTIPFTAESTLKPFVRYTLNNHTFVDFVDEDQDFSRNDLTGVPKNKVDAGFHWLLKDFYWNVTYQFVDEIPLTDANTLNSDAFSLFNTKIGYQKSINTKWTLGLNFGINNIFDKKYARSVLINAVGFGGSEPRYFYPGETRNYYGSFRINYQI
jgi:iron complex outermembrane receptor protein